MFTEKIGKQRLPRYVQCWVSELKQAFINLTRSFVGNKELLFFLVLNIRRRQPSFLLYGPDRLRFLANQNNNTDFLYQHFFFTIYISFNMVFLYINITFLLFIFLLI